MILLAIVANVVGQLAKLGVFVASLAV